MSVLQLVRSPNKEMEDALRALAECAATGEAVGFGGFVRWADGSEQMLLSGPYQDSAQAIKAAAKMKHNLLDDTSF
jgi:hypothetical protein